jgi:hypothetical protein
MSPSNWSKAVSNHLFNFAHAAPPVEHSLNNQPHVLPSPPLCSISGQKFKPIQAKSAHFALYIFYNPQSPSLWNINRAPTALRPGAAELIHQTSVTPH